MSNPVPKYTMWEALNVAIATGMRALEEVRALAGTPAAPGKLPGIRAWTEQVHYEGEIVTFEGRTYQAVCDTGKEPGHDDWLCLAERGSDGRTFTIRGTWAEADDYKSLDVVSLNGASFAARKDKPGPCPGEGWQLIAMQGKQGKPGLALKGDRGLPGPAVKEMAVDDAGMLTLTNADGSVVTCDLYPLLSRIGSR